MSGADCSRLVKLYPMLTFFPLCMLILPPAFKLLLHLLMIKGFAAVTTGAVNSSSGFFLFIALRFTVGQQREGGRRIEKEGGETSEGNAAWEFIIPLKNNLASKALTYLEWFNLPCRCSVWRLTTGV